MGLERLSAKDMARRVPVRGVSSNLEVAHAMCFCRAGNEEKAFRRVLV